ncbi:unnamed protein product [Haemonchus placei]|uniref:Transmembrane protein n=1 Tax=Haemonchus placei TaxID=6290 RepID=A0A0N4X9N7_HAEPC|nr:unnamed protein product [Haemonchus placei]
MVSLFTPVVSLLLLWSNGVVSHYEISLEEAKNLLKEVEAAINTGKRSASESDDAEDAYNAMMELPDHRRTKRRIIEKSPKKARASDLQAEAGTNQMRTGREEPPPDARDPSLSSVDDTGLLFPRSSEKERSKRAVKHRKPRRGRKTTKGKRRPRDTDDDVPAESNMTASNSTDLLGNGTQASDLDKEEKEENSAFFQSLKLIYFDVVLLLMVIFACLFILKRRKAHRNPESSNQRTIDPSVGFERPSY